MLLVQGVLGRRMRQREEARGAIRSFGLGRMSSCAQSVVVAAAQLVFRIRGLLVVMVDLVEVEQVRAVHLIRLEEGQESPARVLAVVLEKSEMEA